MADAAVRSHLRFILNGRDVTLTDVAPDQTLLDWLRLARALKGTKEGCAEGDCGACTVLVGRLTPDGGLVYEGAKAFVDFLLSPEGQQLVVTQGNMPIDPKVAPPKGFPALSEIKLLPMDADKAVETDAPVRARFAEIFGG